MKHELRRRLWTLGVDISRFDPHSHPVARYRLLLAEQMITVVLDVGASSGEWGQVLRDDVGFSGVIYSFEPTRSAYGALKLRAASQANWKAFNIALGDSEGRQTINVAGNSYSSSLLQMLPRHEAAAPESGYVGTETVEVRRLDDVFEELGLDTERVCLKIDTQGYESRVLSGARHSLSRIDVVQLEMSLVPLYEGQSTLVDLLELMFDHGYELVDLERGFSDSDTGQLLQVDGIFRRPSA
jgi:FkbM family methyltransferase